MKALIVVETFYRLPLRKVGPQVAKYNTKENPLHPWIPVILMPQFRTGFWEVREGCFVNYWHATTIRRLPVSVSGLLEFTFFFIVFLGVG